MVPMRRRAGAAEDNPPRELTLASSAHETGRAFGSVEHTAGISGTPSGRRDAAEEKHTGGRGQDPEGPRNVSDHLEEHDLHPCGDNQGATSCPCS